jgi:hypothetical protein
MNASQYTHEILGPHIIPLVYSLPSDSSKHETIEDGHKAHTSAIAEVCCSTLEFRGVTSHPIHQILTLSRMLKDRIKRRIRDHSKRPRGRQELIEAAQEEWEKLDWDKVDKMRGGHIKY